ncbi:MAG TPA: DNA helicase PcrA [Thermoclostridium caenicola]|uniref:DNA helicase PcrA n=1 Tax=Thermoclostridium caenicola TaxID=659425 RepID=UPI002C66736D|nr:DNA helicase PcrA [Thermoclostridium caenicola]HOK43336.1 DNA helicase PcrA [Thermoclostridium caenicola]HOL85051.1 DNA helicase PcrA [Thermoclostridium caenicola]HPO77210.1 DNA helicase PcrA [Thermoclostridium caenicola]
MLLENLNEQQKKAVLHTEGPLLVLAGAGSGKTRVLTHRIAYLVGEMGVSPWNILAITFTNKAAREMKERLEKLIGAPANDLWVGTFHACCVRILRREIERLGYDRSFVIYDTDDQQTLIKSCLEQLGINEKNFPPGSVLHEIGRAKDELISPAQYLKMYASDYRLGKIARIYELYQKKLKSNNALDFDDIIFHTIRIFSEFPEVLDYYAEKFRYIHVDEYQDTNTAQYMLVSMLASKHGNICVVGDDDQMIYGWRGANLRNILDFEKDFKSCRVIKLEQNYRSTKTILEAANHVIQNNAGRKQKRLWTENPEGSLVNRYEAADEHDEAYYIADVIRSLKASGRSYSDMALLYRINAQSRVFEEVFMKTGIPYKIFGGLKFYDRKEIKDVIAWLRLVQNADDDISFSRAINVPKRGIGKTTLDKVEQLAIQEDTSMYRIASRAEAYPELARASRNLLGFCRFVEDLKAMSREAELVDFIALLLDRSGLVRELEKELTPESMTRIENIKEFLSVAQEFAEKAEEKPTLEDFLAHISLVADIDDSEEVGDRVVLMTLHSAKGLEFPVVFIAGMEEGVFPSYRSLYDEDQLEEERRLCYVGITRAQEEIYLTNAKCRMLFGSTSYNRVSRFISEIPDSLIASPAHGRPTPAASNSWLGSRGKMDLNDLKSRIRAFNRASQEEGESVEVGDRVLHKKFGAGTVMKKTPDGGDFQLEIRFDDYGMKRLMESFAKLKKI